MRSTGILLIILGLFVGYAVVHGRLQSSSASSGSSSSDGGSSSGSRGGGGGGGGDSGTHQAIDITGQATGSVGGVYTINKAYGDMSDREKDDANAYARQIGNVSG